MKQHSDNVHLLCKFFRTSSCSCTSIVDGLVETVYNVSDRHKRTKYCELELHEEIRKKQCMYVWVFVQIILIFP